MEQKGFTLAIPIKPGQKETLSKLITANNDRFDFRDEYDTLNTGHRENDATIKCSILTIPAQHRNGGETLKFDHKENLWKRETGENVRKELVLPAMFVIVSSYTGNKKKYLKGLIENNYSLFKQFLYYCNINGRPFDNHEQMLMVFKRFSKVSTFYSGLQFLSKAEMIFEEKLFNHLQNYLDKDLDKLMVRSPDAVYGSLKKEARNFDEEGRLKTKIKKSRFKAFGKSATLNLLALLLIAAFISLGIYYLNWIEGEGFWVLFGNVLLITIGVIILFVLFLATSLIISEKKLKQEEKNPTDGKIRKTLEYQQNGVLNEVSLAGPVKPGFVRVLGNYVMLRAANALKGLLTIPTVFNARWVGLNRYKRFVFFSNFSNQTEGYVRDFIDSTKRGERINLIYGNADGYPRTNYLINNGAIDNPIPFVKTIYYYQQITEFWYAPLKHLSIDNARIHHAVRDGLTKNLIGKELEDWLNYFGGWKRYKHPKQFNLPEPSKEKVMVDDIQSLVASGHKNLPVAYYVFCKIENVELSKAYLRGVSDRITTVKDKNPKLAINIAFSFCGVQKLEGAQLCETEDVNINDWTKTFQREFREGMSDKLRSEFLGDLGQNDSKNWSIGKAPNEFDFMLILLADHNSIDTLYKSEKSLFEASGIIEVNTKREGQFLKNYKEHFGFVDGISNPRIEGIHETPYNKNQVALKPGEFVLGYKNEYDSYSESPKIPAKQKVRKKLAAISTNYKDYFIENGYYNFGKNGSFLVYRKISQDVEKFWKYQADEFANGNSPAAQSNMIKKASKMVGRWPNGSPLTKAKYRNEPSNDKVNLENDFLYYDDDLDGKGCPYGAHIRRANPRDWLVTEERNDWSREMVRKKLMLRRGRVYGPPVVESMETHDLINAVKDGAESLSQERGLHFLALVSNINRQFEFIQNTWFQSRAFAGLKDEVDPIVGVKSGIDGRDDAPYFSCPAHPVRKRYSGLPNFTKLEGGSYLFLPGITAIKYLCDYEGVTERLPKEKAREIERIESIVRKSVQNDDRSKQKRFHVKGYGLIDAKLEIYDSLPQNFKSSILTPGSVYSAYVRFSDAAHNIIDDNKKGVRGLSLKLLDTGHKTLMKTDQIEGETHDFLFTTRPMVHPGTLTAFRKGMEALFGSFWGRITGTISTILTDFPSFFKGLKYRQKHHNLLELEYNSAVPFSAGKASVKWMLRPLKLATEEPKERSKTVLLYQLIKDLEIGEVRFEFGYQTSENPVTEPVNNGSVVWQTEFIPIGELVLPNQNFYSEENNERGNQMNFNVWNVVEDHKPLGDINLARKVVYETMANLRN